MSHDYILKYILLGNTGVGKSCILQRFQVNTFNPMHQQTIGIDFGIKITIVDGLKLKLQIWDITETEGYKTQQRVHYRSTAGALIIYEVTKRDSFNNAVYWIQSAREYGNQDMSIILIGNKIDLESNRQVTTEEGNKLAQQFHLNFLETSAFTGENIEKAFILIAQEILNKIAIKQIDLRDQVIFQNNQNCGIKIPQQRISNVQFGSMNNNTYFSQLNDMMRCVCCPLVYLANKICSQNILNNIKGKIFRFQENCYWYCLSSNALLDAACSDAKNLNFKSLNIIHILKIKKLRITFLKKILNYLDDINIFVEDTLITILKDGINRNEIPLIYDLMMNKRALKLFAVKNNRTYLIIQYSAPYLGVEKIQNIMANSILNNEDKYLKNVLIEILIRSNVINLLSIDFILFLHILPLQIIYNIVYQLKFMNNKPNLPTIFNFSVNDINLFLTIKIQFNIYQQVDFINEIAQKLNFDQEFNSFFGRNDELKDEFISMTNRKKSSMKKLQSLAQQLVNEVSSIQRQSYLQEIIKSIPENLNNENDLEARKAQKQLELDQFRELFISILKFRQVLGTLQAKEILYIRFTPLLLLHQMAVQALDLEGFQNSLYKESEVNKLLNRGHQLQFFNLKARDQVIATLATRFQYTENQESPIKDIFQQYNYLENMENDHYQFIEKYFPDSLKQLKQLKQQNLEKLDNFSNVEKSSFVEQMNSNQHVSYWEQKNYGSVLDSFKNEKAIFILSESNEEALIINEDPQRNK